MCYPSGNPVVLPINKPLLRVIDTDSGYVDAGSIFVSYSDGYINSTACNSTAWSVYCYNIRISACSNMADYFPG
ncbi:hypothetical protein ES703_96823 [subsurface metagenome]